MKNIKNAAVIFMAFHLISLIIPGDAHAYINPGSGSFIVQVIIASLLGGAVTAKLYWSGIKNFFKRLFSGRKKG